MTRAKTATKDAVNTSESALNTFDQELADLGSNPLYDALLQPIRLLIQKELSKAIKALKSDVLTDINREIEAALQPIFALVDRLPSKLLKQAIKTKINTFVNSLKTDLSK